MFDFDGTLTRRDTLGPFLREVSGTAPFLQAFAADAVRLTLAGVGAGSRDAAKERFLRRLVGGREYEALAATGDDYGTAIVNTRMRPEMMARLRWHAAEGHEIAIVSASLDLYLTRVAELLEVPTLLCSRVEVDGAGRLTGGLIGGNCRGPGKLERIRERFGPDGYELWAYGDSAGDDEMLAAADYPVRVHHRTGRFRLPTP